MSQLQLSICFNGHIIHNDMVEAMKARCPTNIHIYGNKSDQIPTVYAIHIGSSSGLCGRQLFIRCCCSFELHCSTMLALKGINNLDITLSAPSEKQPHALAGAPAACSCLVERLDVPCSLPSLFLHRIMSTEQGGSRWTIGCLIFPDFELLDVMGPLEFLGVPCTRKKFRSVLISEHGGPVRSNQGITAMSDYSFADCPHLDVLLVPGEHGKKSQQMRVDMHANRRLSATLRVGLLEKVRSSCSWDGIECDMPTPSQGLFVRNA